MKNKRKIAIILCTVLVAAVTVSAVVMFKKPSQTAPKYVFLFIGDGMGLAHASAADSYLAYEDGGKLGGSYLTFTGFPVTGLCRTWCNNSSVTGSAASGTAIACGEKTDVGHLGTSSEGDSLRSIAYDLRDLGYKVGIMSDGPVNHATPAAFYAHVQKRNAYYDISKEIPATGFDFFGGSEIIDRFGKHHDQEDVVKYIEADGNCDVCFGKAELEKSTAKTKVFLPENPEDEEDFDSKDSNKDYDLSMAGLGLQAADLVEACLEDFGDSSPFFIMCEQGYVDWACHRNSTRRMLESVFQLDRAVKKAYEFYLEHPDETLIVVTSDHETGGFAFGVKNYSTRWDEFDKWWEECGHDDSSLTPEENAQVNSRCSVSWACGSHTGCPVPVYALGCGAERFTGFYENSDLKAKILGVTPKTKK